MSKRRQKTQKNQSESSVNIALDQNKTKFDLSDNEILAIMENKKWTMKSKDSKTRKTASVVPLKNQIYLKGVAFEWVIVSDNVIGGELVSQNLCAKISKVWPIFYFTNNK